MNAISPAKHNYLTDHLTQWVTCFAQKINAPIALLSEDLQQLYPAGGRPAQKTVQAVHLARNQLQQARCLWVKDGCLLILPVSFAGEPVHYVVLHDRERLVEPELSAEIAPGQLAGMRHLYQEVNYFQRFISSALEILGHGMKLQNYLGRLSQMIHMDEAPYDKESLASMIHHVLGKLITVTHAKTAAIAIKDKQTGLLTYRYATGMNGRQLHKTSFSTRDSLPATRVLQHKRAASGKDAGSLLRGLEQKLSLPIQAYLGVPIMTKNDCFGVLELINTETGRPFSDEDRNMCRVIGNHISILYKTYAYINEEKKHRQELQRVNQKLVKAQSDLNAFVIRVSALYKISKVIRSTLNIDEMSKNFINVISKATKSDEVFIFLKDEKEYKLVLYGAPTDYMAASRFVTIPYGKGIEGIVAQTRMAIAIAENAINDPRYRSIPDLELKFFNSIFALPIIVKDRVIGVLELRNGSKRQYSQSDRKLILAIADQVGMAIENALLHKKTEILSLTDEMTGLYNFRYFQKKLRDELLRSKRYHRDVSLLICDIDHFKHVNDTYGHIKGDMVLKAISQRIMRTVRDVDSAARYGGEEFAVILPETKKDDAFAIADRIRANVGNIQYDAIEDLAELTVTISIGVASFPEDAREGKALIEHADHALYQAKQAGRNRVMSYGQ